jgi:hypothetical protein
VKPTTGRDDLVVHAMTMRGGVRMLADPSGHVRLRRSLGFIGDELREGNDLADGVERAIALSAGSPSEFPGDALLALERLVSEGPAVPPSLRAFAVAVAAEIRQGFDRVGGA